MVTMVFGYKMGIYFRIPKLVFLLKNRLAFSLGQSFGAVAIQSVVEEEIYICNGPTIYLYWIS